MGWSEFVLAFVAFFASHLVPTRPPIKTRIIAMTGQRGYTMLYSGLSLAVLIWLVAAAGRAPYVQLWPWALWQVYVTHLAMLAVCLILSLSIGRPNPFSFGGGAGPFRPERPGLVRWMRHPILIALALWAGAHLLVNGALAHVILFGLFLAFALIGRRGIDRRKRRQMGPDWDALNAARHTSSRSTLVFEPQEFAVRVCVGGALYLALLILHPLFAGVSALP